MSPEPLPIQRLALTTTDGLSLRAEMALPQGGAEAATAAAVLCHPHPLHGGNMFAPVPDGLFRALPAAGLAALRFNFRGVDGSDGSHDYGQGERLDVDAAIARLSDEVGVEIPLITASWSFGADVSLATGPDRLGGWLCVAPPLRIIDPSEMVAAADERPCRLLVPEHDQFMAPDAATQTTAEWTNTELAVIEQADHFVAGKLGWIADQTIDFARSL